MSWFSLILASLFTLYVGLLSPLFGHRRYQAFLKEIAVDPAARARYYRRNLIISKWLLLVVIGIILLFGFAPISALGLQAPDSWTLTLWLLAEFVILLPIVQVVYLRKKRRTGPPQLIVVIKELLPYTSYERLLWILVSITAGVCEEIIFRGFLPMYFFSLGPFLGFQVSYLVAVILSIALFGFAHFYQGWKGVLATALLGALFACLYAFTGSLILPIIIHILVDARCIFWVPLILKRYKQGEDVQTSAG